MLKAQDKDTLLFDLDGTLVDSAPDLAASVNLALQQLQRDNFDEATIRSWVGNGAKVLIERALSGNVNIDDSLDDALAAQALTTFLNIYEQHLCEKTCLYPDVEETLRKLKAAGYRMAIVTNKPERFVAPILEGLGIDDLFELIIGGDTLEQRKPHPLPIQYACEQMNVSINRSVMIGDSKNDILAAKAANMPSVGLTYGYNYGEDIAIYKPEWRLENFAELLDIFSA